MTALPIWENNRNVKNVQPAEPFETGRLGQSNALAQASTTAFIVFELICVMPMGIISGDGCLLQTSNPIRLLLQVIHVNGNQEAPLFTPGTLKASCCEQINAHICDTGTLEAQFNCPLYASCPLLQAMDIQKCTAICNGRIHSFVLQRPLRSQPFPPLVEVNNKTEICIKEKNTTSSFQPHNSIF